MVDLLGTSNTCPVFRVHEHVLEGDSGFYHYSRHGRCARLAGVEE